MQFGAEVWRKITIAATLMVLGTVLTASLFYSITIKN
jgi:hypothetical protein